jgi:hypothetical protein
MDFLTTKALAAKGREGIVFLLNKVGRDRRARRLEVEEKITVAANRETGEKFPTIFLPRPSGWIFCLLMGLPPWQ